MSLIEKELTGGDIELSDPSKLPSSPLVSVDMITYDHGLYISEAIESVLIQNVDFSYEICIGEDGSNDGTRQTCIDYAKRYPEKIRLFLRSQANPERKEFKAPYMYNAAKTFDACRGKYIAMLEGDDYWINPRKLRTQVRQLEENTTMAASCHYAAVGLDERPWAWTTIPGYPVGELTARNLLRRDVGNLHTSTWLLRRGKPVDWSSFKSSSFGDYPIFISTLLAGPASVLQNVWSVYRIHKGGVFSPLSNEVRLRANVELWRCFQDALPSDFQSSVAFGLCRTLALLLGCLRKAGRYAGALSVCKELFREISSLDCARDRASAHFLAIEALVFPYAKYLRERLNGRKGLR
jgi:glycosyltransferase involved in cell wall biosynthesis